MKLIKYIFISCLCCVSLWSLQALAQSDAAKVPLRALSGTTNVAVFVYINGTKYRLLQRYPNHWVLYDLQLFQAVHLLNQLVVSGQSAVFLRKQLRHNNKITLSKLAAEVYLLTGTIAELMQIEQQLKSASGLTLEWQLRYLPLNPATES